MVTGPTFEEMLHPQKINPALRADAVAALDADPLNPVNLYNITWRDPNNEIYHVVLPKALTGVEAEIVLIYGGRFPSGSHKVGAAYSVLLEMQLMGQVDPALHTLVWPSTGNYGIGGAFIGCRMEYDSVVVLPEEMSEERFERIRSYGARIIRTAGSESNVKEIYDEVKRLRASDANIRILNQFEVMGNYRFHYHVTGNTLVELAGDLQRNGIGSGRISAYVSAMGSAGTIAAGDRLKQVWPDHKIIGLEPIQCPTLYNNGYGAHEIQGIGDKHVTWIHNVLNMDALMAIDDRDCLQGLRLLAEETGRQTLTRRFGIDEAQIQFLAQILGISGICNIIGAIKTAKFYGMSSDDVVVTVATDAMERYGSVMSKLRDAQGPLDEAGATAIVDGCFRRAGIDWVQEGSREARERWHNLKYYTWVEQQGKSVAELDAQRDPAWWIGHQERVEEIDGRLLAQREQRRAIR
ncbi:MAG: pyridoxal-phosphate dependent enzyme [Chloroflexi bacterium]|nr:pyridoxal-phosphate dependent enzyme [Chloroflexota bacterium]